MITDTMYQYEKLWAWRQEALTKELGWRQAVLLTCRRWVLLNDLSRDDETRLSRAGGGRA